VVRLLEDRARAFRVRWRSGF
jgi:hypothetical protein